MKRILSFALLISIVFCKAMAGVGDFSITPFISNEYLGVNLNQTTQKQLNSKLIQIITANNAYGAVDNRFIITPHINVISQETTATIPQKTVAKVEITFCIGDGITGTLFQSATAEYSGVGDTLEGAVASAIIKIRPNDTIFKNIVSASKQNIISYYNGIGRSLIVQAKTLSANLEYELAISKLMIIPQGCTYYDEAQTLVYQYGSQILKRDNNTLLVKAKSAWAASPNYAGAEEASTYLSQICITDDSIKKDVNQLIKQINSGLTDLRNKEYELAMREIESNEAIQTAEIKATAQVATSIFDALPTVVYNIARWFIF